MRYYKFHIGDYLSHTGHLEPLEDLAYRRMMDYCYLREEPLPNNVEEIARLISMRTHCDSISNVLREFWVLHEDHYYCERVQKELQAVYDKSEKARQSAEARWLKVNKKGKNANAMRKESERNATHNPLPTTHKQERTRKTIPPTLEEVIIYCKSRGNNVNCEQFINFYQSKNWMVGKNKMKDWQASVRTWEQRDKNNGSYQRDNSAVARVKRKNEQNDTTQREKIVN